MDANSGADGWALTPRGTRGVLSDAVSIYFADATLTSEFIARWMKVHSAAIRLTTSSGVNIDVIAITSHGRYSAFSARC